MVQIRQDRSTCWAGGNELSGRRKTAEEQGEKEYVKKSLLASVKLPMVNLKKQTEKEPMGGGGKEP